MTNCHNNGQLITEMMKTCHIIMKSSFWDGRTEDTLTAICALVLLVFIKTTVMSWFIQNISLWRHKQQHNNYLKRSKLSPPVGIEKIWRLESRPQRKPGGDANVGDYIVHAVLFHFKVSDFTGHFWLSFTGLVAFYPSHTGGVEMHNSSFFSVSV